MKTARRPDLLEVDRGYGNHVCGKTPVPSGPHPAGPALGPRGGSVAAGVIELEIGHKKTCGHPARSPLKGVIGEALFGAQCSCGDNIRKLRA